MACPGPLDEVGDGNKQDEEGGRQQQCAGEEEDEVSMPGLVSGAPGLGEVGQSGQHSKRDEDRPRCGARNVSLHRQDPSLQGIADQVGMGTQAQFAHHVGAMDLNGARADEQPLGDFTVGVTLNRQMQHFPLAGS
jgi:hypothetical protein